MHVLNDDTQIAKIEYDENYSKEIFLYFCFKAEDFATFVYKIFFTSSNFH